MTFSNLSSQKEAYSTCHPRTCDISYHSPSQRKLGSISQKVPRSGLFFKLSSTRDIFNWIQAFAGKTRALECFSDNIALVVMVSRYGQAHRPFSFLPSTNAHPQGWQSKKDHLPGSSTHTQGWHSTSKAV